VKVPSGLGYPRAVEVCAIGNFIACKIMTLWHTYYHLVWATYDRLPLITVDREPQLYQCILQTIQGLEAQCHAIGGMPDHIHLIVSIPPKISIAEFVKRIKGRSARYINQSEPDKTFAWQREYSVFSLGSQQTDRAIEYVKNQKQRHHIANLIDSLEMTP
jgi:putative transposase